MTRRVAVASALAVVLFALAYLSPLTVGKGSEMDEGAVVAYASRVLDGAVPHRDFLTFYGPGNPWLVAGAFAVFGESVGVERAVGTAYRLIVVLSLFVLGWKLGGIFEGVAVGVVAMTIMAEELIWAYATYGALAFGLLGLALLAVRATAPRSRGQTAVLVAGGVASGLAVLIRFDVAAAVVVASVPILLLAASHARRSYGAAFLATITIYVAHLAIVGPERAARVATDILAAGPGRYLPRQSVWDFPGNLLAVASLATAALLVIGAGMVWRRREALEARIVLSAGLFSVALLPLTISRMDPGHVRAYAVVPLSLTPALAFCLVRSTTRRLVWIPAALVVFALVVTGVVHYGRYTADHFRSLRDVRSGYRGFYDDDSEGARVLVERLGRSAAPGESLFVGPQDLRRTNYGPTYMYFALRQLEPASYYMEMNPGTANRKGSGLADELRRADWLILTSEWDNWDEPNESMEYGPSEPNEVVRDDFGLLSEAGEYRLYERCDRTA